MSWLVASTGPGGMPSDRAVTFAEPPGTIASAGTCPVGVAGAAEQAVDHVADRAVAAVHDDQVDPVLGGRLRDFAAVAAVSVCSTVSSRRLFSACASRSRPAVVVDVAVGLTISTARMTPKPTERDDAGRNAAEEPLEGSARGDYADAVTPPRRPR